MLDATSRCKIFVTVDAADSLPTKNFLTFVLTTNEFVSENLASFVVCDKFFAVKKYAPCDAEPELNGFILYGSLVS